MYVLKAQTGVHALEKALFKMMLDNGVTLAVRKQKERNYCISKAYEGPTKQKQVLSREFLFNSSKELHCKCRFFGDWASCGHLDDPIFSFRSFRHIDLFIKIRSKVSTI